MELNRVSLSTVYRMMLTNIDRFPEASADLDDLRQEVAGADEELLQDIRLFEFHVQSLAQSIQNGDSNTIIGSLVYIRGHAMNISTIFSNLANSIEEVAFTSES